MVDGNMLPESVCALSRRDGEGGHMFEVELT